MKIKYHEGIFYPSDRDKLSSLIHPVEKKEEARAVIVPHREMNMCAELLRKAASHFGSPDLVIILSPIHSGRIAGDSNYSFFEGEENEEEGIITLGAKKSEWYAEEEPAAEILLPFIHEYCPSTPVAIIYCDITKATESRELASFLKEHSTPDTLFIISTNLSGICSSIEERDSYMENAVNALTNGENILDLTNKNRVRICAKGAVDSINRIIRGEWKLDSTSSSDTTAYAVLWK